MGKRFWRVVSVGGRGFGLVFIDYDWNISAVRLMHL